MHKRTVAALLSLGLAAACGSPTEPESGLTGQWSGSLLVATCQRNNGFPFSSGCGASEMPGSTVAAALTFDADKPPSILGYSGFGGWAEELLNVRPVRTDIFNQFDARLRSDATLEFIGGVGGSGQIFSIGTEQHSWSLKVVNADRLEGTLSVRRTRYREPGDTVITGTVVLARLR